MKWSPKIPASHKIEITYQNRPLKNSPWTAHWINSRDYTELNHPDFKPVVIGREGNGPGEFSRPWGVCALPNGRFAVADRSNNRKCNENSLLLVSFSRVRVLSKPDDPFRLCR